MSNIINKKNKNILIMEAAGGGEVAGVAGGGVALPLVRTLAEAASLLRRCGARAAVLELAQLQAFWLSLMADRAVPVAQRLQASRYYADSLGAFSGSAGGGGGGRTSVRWGSVAPVDAVAVPVEPSPPVGDAAPAGGGDPGGG